jgi:hypothetical protein
MTKLIATAALLLAIMACKSGNVTVSKTLPVSAPKSSSNAETSPCVTQVVMAFESRQPELFANSCDHRMVAVVAPKFCAGPNAGQLGANVNLPINAYDRASPGPFGCGWFMNGEHP